MSFLQLIKYEDKKNEMNLVGEERRQEKYWRK